MTVEILTGDCRDVLATLPDESVHCVVTSPPYWGLRDYGTAAWDGGDPDCGHIKAKGNTKTSASSTLTTNGGRGPQPGNKYHHETGVTHFQKKCAHCGAVRVDRQLGLEPTLGEHIATMVAVFREVRRVLRKDGTVWLNYGDCYATAPNGRSAADTKAAGNDGRTFRDKPFSTVGGTLKPKDLCMVPNRLAIALQDDGWWVRSEIIWHKPNPMPESITDRPTSSHEKVFLLAKAGRYFFDADAVREPHKRIWDKTNGGSWAHTGQFPVGSKQGHHSGDYPLPNPVGRNIRNIWTVATAPFPGAHFATFPPALVEPCIKAGCPEGGTVLDPFGGAGTVGMVADRLGRDAILIELNEEYAAMARKRIDTDAATRGEGPVEIMAGNDLPLFTDTPPEAA